MFENISAINAEQMQKRGYNTVKLAFIDYLSAKREADKGPCELLRNFKNECLAAYKAAVEVYEAIFDEEWILTDYDREIIEKTYKDIFGGETK